MPLDQILVKGARERSLKNIDVRIPRDKQMGARVAPSPVE